MDRSTQINQLRALLQLNVIVSEAVASVAVKRMEPMEDLKEKFKMIEQAKEELAIVEKPKTKITKKIPLKK